MARGNHVMGWRVSALLGDGLEHVAELRIWLGDGRARMTRGGATGIDGRRLLMAKR